MDFKEAILRELGTMVQAEKQRRIATSRFKAAAYTKVIRQIDELPHVYTYEDVAGIEGIGEKINEKIKEILATGKLGAAERAKAELPLEEAAELQQVYGIGPAKAKTLINTGIKSISQLRDAAEKNPELLTAAQKLGLKHYEDSLLRIPRAEMGAHERYLLGHLPADFRGTVVGSYRRGLGSSGDIDFLITLPSEISKKEQGRRFAEFLGELRRQNYLVGSLSEGPSKFLGFARIAEAAPVRRIDILLLPESEYGFGILYFTGSKEFNVEMRKRALAQGYSLSEHGLKAMREKVELPPEMRTEKEIFAFLKLPYVAPEMRKGAESFEGAGAAGAAAGEAKKVVIRRKKKTVAPEAAPEAAAEPVGGAGKAGGGKKRRTRRKSREGAE